MLNTIAILITAAALFSYLNQRFIRLPTTIDLMVVALGLLVTLVLLGWSALRLQAETFLRGSVSVALALSLPLGPEREVILAVTYLIVVFYITVQGLTIGRVIRHWTR